MNKTPELPAFLAQEQFRMYRLQVFNWGTFSEIHDIPIATQGFLFVGPSGSGKSTLLDAFSALLVPSRWLDFNAAAHESERSGRDRSVVTYVRGAWAEQKDDQVGMFVTRYLRPGTTWSALALSYRNKMNREVTLVQIFWVRGTSNHQDDFKRYYLIFERSFDLRELEDFGLCNFDVRKLKQKFSTAFMRDKFRPYGEHFCHLLGIENDMALRLLHKTQSAKNLGDLNTFLRDFMLDKPETFVAADRLVNEFGELNSAHQAVVTARKQIETLLPAQEQHHQWQAFTLERNQLEELKQGIHYYCEHHRIALLKKHMAALTIQSESKSGEVIQSENSLNNHTALLRDLEQQHRDQGGDRIEQWETEQHNVAKQRDACLRREDHAKQACQQLGWIWSSTPQGFAEIVGHARQEIESWKERANDTRDELMRLANQRHTVEVDFIQTKKEIASLRVRPSNIPADMFELRRDIAANIHVNESALLFVGELIEVKSEESLWQGAIERVLHGFALSILVEESHYAALSTYLNSTHLAGRRLVYYRTESVIVELNRPIASDSLILKLKVKPSVHTEWLQQELRKRFDYSCVDSLRAFRQAERAITQEGQIKHNKTRHEKDDRRQVDDRRYWVLGFSNREKLALFEKQAQKLADDIAQFTDAMHHLSEKAEQQTQRTIHCQTLINLTWQEIDPTPFLTRLSQLEQAIQMARSKNSELQRLSEHIAKQKQQVTQLEKQVMDRRVEWNGIQKAIEQAQQQLATLLENPLSITLTPTQQRGLDERFAALKKTMDLHNIDLLGRKVLEGIVVALEAMMNQMNQCVKIIETRFADFVREWPAEASGLDGTLAAAPDFFAKLQRLEMDGLPAHEHRFFELLKSQSQQNIAALSSYLNDARQAILERMELVNESLGQAPFNQDAQRRTFLHIDVSDRYLVEVKEFKHMLQQTLTNVWSDDAQSAETRFLILRSLVERLGSQESDLRRWRELVLDVRQHVEFVGRERDEQGTDIEVYRSGTGKSGGQRQKLATTCLAAALRYQLGGHHHGIPLYAPVILDEAFDKADNEFTTLAMNIFINFGFQMIVATPLKAVMTLEPFIGGACFVEINDRRISSVLLIEYDDAQHKLKLPAHESVLNETT